MKLEKIPKMEAYPIITGIGILEDA
jgi:hypothetical protein